MKQRQLLPLTLLRERHTHKLIRRLSTTLKQLFPDHFNKPKLRGSRRTDMHSFFVPGTSKRVRLHSMFYEGVRAYNNLPLHIRAAPTRKQFNEKLKLWCIDRLQTMRSTAPKAAGVAWCSVVSWGALQGHVAKTNRTIVMMDTRTMRMMKGITEKWISEWELKREQKHNTVWRQCG